MKESEKIRKVFAIGNLGFKPIKHAVCINDNNQELQLIQQKYIDKYENYTPILKTTE